MKFLSIDVSSSNLGLSEFLFDINDNLKLEKIKHFSLNNDIPIFQRFEEFEKYLQNQEKLSYIVLEERLKSFSQGNTNKNALLACSVANEVCSYISYQYCKNIFKFYPISVRSILGIKKVENIKEFIVNYTITDKLFQDYLIENKKLLDDVFPQREFTKGKNKGKKVFLTGVEDMCDSFVIGKSSLLLLNKKHNQFYNEIFSKITK